MLLVPTYLDKSPIHGIGLFTKEPIEKGSVVWKYEETLDRKYSAVFLVGSANPMLVGVLNRYGYVNANVSVLCGDDARFMNFGIPANTECGEPVTENEWSLLAARDIQKGEEITVPLNSDGDWARKLSQ